MLRFVLVSCVTALFVSACGSAVPESGTDGGDSSGPQGTAGSGGSDRSAGGTGGGVGGVGGGAGGSGGGHGGSGGEETHGGSLRIDSILTGDSVGDEGSRFREALVIRGGGLLDARVAMRQHGVEHGVEILDVSDERLRVLVPGTIDGGESTLIVRASTGSAERRVWLFQGEVGPRGERGPQGEQGPQGERGPEGEHGAPGERGPEGPVGPQGPQGDRGFQGPKGDKGDKGDRGDRGLQGERGLKGDKGDKGAKGEDAFQEIDTLDFSGTSVTSLPGGWSRIGPTRTVTVSSAATLLVLANFDAAAGSLSPCTHVNIEMDGNLLLSRSFVPSGLSFWGTTFATTFASAGNHTFQIVARGCTRLSSHDSKATVIQIR